MIETFFKTFLPFPLQIHYNDFMNSKFDALTIHPIAYIETDFPTKFGIPRQADIVSSLQGRIIFKKEYNKEGILRGLEEFSHLWLIWGFSENETTEFSPTIRPPKLGGNQRVGVFASRSPNRPNPLGISVVKIEKILPNNDILVSGVDMVSHTPIYDIKPYIPYSDSITEAASGYAKDSSSIHLSVTYSEGVLKDFPLNKVDLLTKILSQDPRPGFHHNNERIYGFQFLDFEIKFQVYNDKELLVKQIEKVK